MSEEGRVDVLQQLGCRKESEEREECSGREGGSRIRRTIPSPCL